MRLLLPAQLVTLCLLSQASGILSFAPFSNTQTCQFMKTHGLPSNNQETSVRKNHRTKQLALHCEQQNRRDLLGSIVSAVSVSSSILILPHEAYASAEKDSSKKPFAPVETLLPAVRVKLSIETAISLTNSLRVDDANANANAKTNANANVNVETIQELENILIKPQNYVQKLELQGVPSKPADLYLDSYKPMKGDLPFQRNLIKNGDVRTWKQLKKREKEQERSNEIRAALNAYTDALSFSGDSYMLNVDKATRSSMVREDRLPDVKQVITSDMGMRYLYRNQILTAMDDVKAEMEYQAAHLDEFDESELRNLLVLTGNAMDRWFSLIDPSDVKEAFDYVHDRDAL